MMVDVDFTLSREFLTDLLITAVEGGVGYWADIRRYDPDKGTVQLREAADFNDPPGEWMTLTWEDLQAAVGQALVEGHFNRNQLSALLEEDAGYFDAYDADALVQIALLGEVTYG